MLIRPSLIGHMPEPTNHDPEDWIGSGEALRRLRGIIADRKTLARKAERGFIRFTRLPDSTHRRYWAEDIDRIVARAKSGQAA